MAAATQFRRFKRSHLTGIGAPSPPSGSGHSTATEEPAQSGTLPPTSPHAIVWCGDAPVLQSPDDRRERCPMSASQPQRPHQSEPRDSQQQARGVHPRHSNGNSHMALGDRRSERTTAGSGLGCARGRHPRLGLAVRCGDLALSLKKTCLFVRFLPFFFTCSQNTKMAPFSLILKVFGHVWAS